MASPASMASNPLGYMGVNFYQNPPFIVANRNPTSLDQQLPGTRWMSTVTLPYVIYETTGAGVWNSSPSITNLAISGTLSVAGVSSLHATNVTGAITATTTITAGTGLTATTGNISATNGNIVLGTAGNKLVYTSVASTTTAGANSAGSVALVAGTATVATTAVTANSLIRLTVQALGTVTTAKAVAATAKTASTSFVITSADATDTSTIFWEIVN